VRPALIFPGIVIALLGVLLLGGVLQIPPSAGATKVASHEPAPLQDAPLISTRETPHWTPSPVADPAGFSLAFRTTGTPGTRYVTYEVRCSPSSYPFLYRSTFEVQLTATFAWFTDPAGGDNPDLEGNCYIVIAPAGFTDVVVGAAPGACAYGGMCAAFVAWGEGEPPAEDPEGPITQGPTGPANGPESTAPAPEPTVGGLTARQILGIILLLIGGLLVLVGLFV